MLGTPAEIFTTTCHYVGIPILVQIFGRGVVSIATDAAPHFGVDRTQAAVTGRVFISCGWQRREVRRGRI